MTGISAITAITIEAQPANVTRTLTYDKTTAKFSGSVMLPIGVQTLTAVAYAGTQVAGQGTTTVTIVAGQTASVFLRILDTSSPAPMPDSSPGIFALVASTTKAAVGEAVTLKASAADPNGDPLTYAWTSSCPSGTFSTTDSAETTWSSTAVGVCTLTITATAKGKSASQQVDVVVLETGSGVATVEGSYISGPRISSISASATGFNCSGFPVVSDATCSQSLAPGQHLSIAAYVVLDEAATVDGGAPVDVTLTDNCGGTTLYINQYIYTSGGGVDAKWTAPAAPAMCVVTLNVTQESMVDQRSLAIVVR